MGERPPASALERLNPDLMNPKRFLIATLLYVLGPRTMGELFKALGLTWGDLDSNIRRLRERGYVRTKKVLTLRGPRTLVELTEEGIREYERLVEELRELLEAVRRSAESDSRGRSESGERLWANALVQPAYDLRSAGAPPC